MSIVCGANLQAYTLRTYEYYKYWWGISPAMPIIDSFTGMDHGNEDKKIAGNNQSLQRRVAYLIMQSGGAGWGHLAEGIWNNCWEQDDCGCCADIWGGAPWHDAVDFSGGHYMQRAFEFYSSINWWQLVPRFANPQWGVFHDPLHSPLASDGDDIYVVYFYNKDTNSGILKNMDNSSWYTAKWYDPRKGEYMAIASEIRPSHGKWTIPSKPDVRDWVLLVTKNRDERLR